MPEGPVRRRRRLVPAAVLLALFFGAFVVGSARADGTLTVKYVGCTGLSVTPSPAPSGSVSVLVYDDDNCNAAFTLTGPGVNFSSDLNSTGMGIDHPAGPFGPFNLQAGATYTVRDSNINASASFSPTGGSTSSTGGSTGGSTGSSGGSTGSTGGSTSSGGKTSGSTSSSTGKTLGTLVGTISSTGKATLKLGGATVKKLKAGVYKLTVTDQSKKAGLVIQALGYHAMSESAVSGTGTKTTTLRVIPAKYFFQATGGPRTYFTVTS
jgi:hypothetical protein